MSALRGKSPASSSTNCPESSLPRLRSSTPPTEVLTSSPVLTSCSPPLNPISPVYKHILGAKGTIKSPLDGSHKCDYIGYDLFPGDHDHEVQAVPSSPTKKRKTLKTSLHCARSSEVSNSTLLNAQSIGCGRGCGTYPEPSTSTFENIPPFQANPILPSVTQSGTLNEHFVAAATMIQMGPPVDTLQDHQSRRCSTLLSQNRLRPYSNPPLSRAASVISGSQPVMSNNDEDAETSYSHRWRHAKCGSSRKLVRETHQITYHVAEDQNIVYWAQKLPGANELEWCLRWALYQEWSVRIGLLAWSALVALVGGGRYVLSHNLHHRDEVLDDNQRRRSDELL
ncbi:hypothetical protein BDR07DRAFT_1477638 [Suillus spraguei]|nr:hypothetical protein BDR07DRAFT_1477638 [Suillus spraguei]